MRTSAKKFQFEQNMSDVLEFPYIRRHTRTADRRAASVVEANCNASNWNGLPFNSCFSL